MTRRTALQLLVVLWLVVVAGLALLYGNAPDCPPSQFEGGRYHSQMYEDYILGFVFEDVDDGVFVDVGANHPDHFSVTRLFSDRGWHGVNIDANPQFQALYAAQRPNDINLFIGISDEPGTLTLYKVSDAPGEARFEIAGLSTFDRSIAAEHRSKGFLVREIEVPVVRLDGVLAEHEVRHIDFLNVDVEGFERNVLRSIDFEVTKPRVVVIESTYPLTSEPVHQDWEQILLDHGYTFALADQVNRYYVRAEDVGLIERFEQIGLCVAGSLQARGL